MDPAASAGAIDTAPQPAALLARYLVLEEEEKALAARVDQAITELMAPLVAKRTELGAAKLAILRLGEGKYTAPCGRTCSVVPANPGTKQPDTFALPDKLHEEEARALAGEDFKRLFDRHVYYTPKPGFEGAAAAVLRPAKARKLCDLLRVLGKITGARAAYIAWSKR